MVIMHRNREYRRTHKDEISQYNKRYYQRHKDREKQRARKYYHAHKEERIQYAREYRNVHRSEFNQRAYKHRKTYPDRVKQCKRKYRKAHPDRVAQSYRKYRQTHRDKVRRWNTEHKGKGFVPLIDNPFPPSIPIDWHHLLPNQPYVVPIPQSIHRAVMGERHFIHNLSAFIWLMTGLGAGGSYDPEAI